MTHGKWAWCFRLLVALSLLAVLLALYRADYLRMPSVVSVGRLALSLVCLAAGFVVSTLSWRAVVRAAGLHASAADCVAGMGMSIFGKYVPGKVWTVAGRAAYLAGKQGHPMARLTALSLKAQLLHVWTGLTFGAVGLFVVGRWGPWGALATLLWLALTAVLFSSPMAAAARLLIKRITGREVRIPGVDVKTTVAVLPAFAAVWALWSTGFGLLAGSLVDLEVPWAVGLGLPLAASLGVLAVIAPGGLGVREGVLAGYLVLAGLPIAEATTLSIASRLWFLCGETFIFIAGIGVNMFASGVRETDG